MRTILFRLFQAVAFSSVLFSSQVAAESLDGISTPIKTSTGQTVILDPTDGFITVGQPLLRAEWSWINRPSLSVAEFSDASLLRPSVTIDVPGTYLAELALFDAADPSALVPLATTRLEVSTDNLTPVARIAARGLSDADTPFILDGSQSYDVDGDALSYQWTVLSAPDNATVTFSAPNEALSSLSYSDAGVYEIALEVTDATGRISIPALYRFDVTGGSLDAGDALPVQATLGTFNLVSEQFDGRQEVEGRTFIGSTVENITGQFGFAPAQDGASFAELYVDGDLRSSTINLTPGDEVRISGTQLQSNVNNGVLVENATDLPQFDFGYFRSYSAFLATLTGEAPGLQDQNNKRFGGTPNAVTGEAEFGPNTRIVTTSMQALQTGGYTIDVSQSDTVIINVSGTSGTFQMNPLGGTPSAENVLWNFHEATSINVNAVIMGHVLAPNAVMTGFAGSSEGSVIAREVQLTNGELHQRAWNGQLPVVEDTGSMSRVVPPTASSDFDQIAGSVGVPIQLNSYASTDLDSDALSASAFLLNQPSGSAPSLVVGSDQAASFTADLPGDYLIAYEVSDGRDVSVDHILISVDAGNTRPVARIDPLSNATVGSTALLDGTQSYDLDGDLLSYGWSLAAAPEGSAAILTDTSTPLSSFTPDLAGLYVLQLLVNDGTTASVPTSIPLVVGAPLPVANAGLDLLPNFVGQAFLDGSLSVGSAPVFEWTAGNAGNFDDPTFVSPTFTLPAGEGSLSEIVATQPVYEQRRSDLGDLCQFDTRIPVDIANPGQAWWHGILFRGTGSVSTDAGNRPVWLIENRRDPSREIVLIGTDETDYGTWTVPGQTNLYLTTPTPAPGAQIRALLDGTQVGQGDAQSWSFNRTDLVCADADTSVAQLVVSDANGVSLPDTVFVGNADIRPVLSRSTDLQARGGETVMLSAAGLGFDANSDELSFSWSLLSRPEGSITAVSTDPSQKTVSGVTLDVTPDRPGLYLVQLEASDGLYEAEPVVLAITVVNAAPVASASVTSPVFVGELATLDGTASFDPDADALSYAWSIVSAPAASTATVLEPTSPTTSFTPDVRGTYVFELSVADTATSNTAQTTLTVPNRAPTAVLEGPSDVSSGEEITLSAVSSSDPDGDTLSYDFTIISSPAGSDPVLVDLGVGLAGFASNEIGNYEVEVTVSDGFLASTIGFEISVVGQNRPPVLGDLNAVYTVELGLELALDLTGSDPDGDEVSFFATPLPLETGISLDSTNGRVRFRPEQGQIGNYSFTVGVSDGTLNDDRVLNIEVVAGTASDTSVFGRILDGVNSANGIETPLAGIPVRLRDAALMTTTDNSGNFRFGSLSGGLDQVIIEPSANGGPGGYVGTARPITITQNQNRDLSPDFLLTPLNDGCATVVAGVETVLTGTTSGVTVRIAADTILEASGSLYEGEVCLGALPQQFPDPGLPSGTQACNIYAIDARGAEFSQGASFTAPNVDGLPEQTRLRLHRLSSTSGMFRPISDAFVDAGASTVSANATRFSEPTLFTFLPQPPKSLASADQPTGNRMLTVFEGDLSEVYTLPGYRAFNQTQQIGLSYHSQAANPTIIVAGDVTIASDASLPLTLSTTLDIGGLEVVDTNQWTPRTGANGQTPALVGEELTLRQSMPLDASGFQNGRYSYEFQSQAKYSCSTVSSNHRAELYVQNQADSPYGTGWSIDDLQTLTLGADGKVSIIDDDGVVTFNPEPNFTEFDEDARLTFPARGPQGINAVDINQDGQLDIVFGDSGTGTVQTILNMGNRQMELSGMFEVAQANEVPETGTFPPILQSALEIDFNQDGFPDLAYSTQITNSLGYLVNEGFGEFENVERFSGIGEGVTSLHVVDIDGDGFDDAIYGGFRGFFGFGTSTVWVDFGGSTTRTNIRINSRGFGDPPLQFDSFDVNGDGQLDIIYRDKDGVQVLLNRGNRSFGPFFNNFGGPGVDLLGKYFDTADLNSDGLDDFVVVTPTEGIQVFLRDPIRFFFPAVKYAVPAGANGTPSLFLLDVNDDNREDIVVSYGTATGSEVAVFKGEGGDVFLPPEIGLVDYPIGDQVAADIDGDGSLDLVSLQRFTVTVDFSKPSASGNFVSGAGEFSQLTRLPDGSWERRYKNGMVAVFDAGGLQTAMVDRQGNRIEYGYDTQGRLETKTDQVGGVTQLAYGPRNRLASITYPDGRVTEFEYDDVGTLNQITEPTGSTVSFSFDRTGRLVSTTNQNGNSSQYSYDAVGNMLGASLPDGSKISNQVASSLGLVNGLGGPATQPLVFVAPEDRITTAINRKGEVTEIEVNQFGSIVRTTDPLGRVTRVIRDEQNLVREVQKPSDVVSSGVRIDRIDYDGIANVTSMTEAVGTPQERSTQYGYELEFNKVTRKVDPDGFETRYEYDAFGEATKIIDGEAGERLFSYTPEGQLLSRTDENGNQTDFTYNLESNLDQITYADGSVTRMTYDSSGNATVIAEAQGTSIERQIQRTYDALNRVLTVEVTGADGAQIDGLTTYTYQQNGNVATVTDETNLVTTFGYDMLERLVSIDDPAEGISSRIYNMAGELTEYVNSDGESFTYLYDQVSRTIQTTDPEGFVKSYTYDQRDNILSVSDGRLGLTQFGYDPLDRIISRTDPIDETITRTYDGRDNLTALTREDGAVETATYDGLSRRTQVVTPDNTLIYAFDPRSNLIEATDNDSRVTFTYDERNRLQTTTTDGSIGLQPAVTLSYGYDLLDRRVSILDSLGGTTSYVWDPEDRLANLTTAWGTAYSFGYDGEGRRTALTSSSGRDSSYTYTNGLLSALNHIQSGIALTDLNYAYDIDAQLVEIADNLDPSKSKAISYDQLNRLVQVAEGIPAALGGIPVPVEDFAYDEEGNRTVSHLSMLYNSNGHNQLLEDETYLYAYDPKGNRTSRAHKVTGEVETYTYDSQNRLVGYASPSTTASYAYDALDRRVAKTVNGSTEAFIYDPWSGYSTTNDVILDFTDGTLTTRWQHSSHVDEPIAFERYSGTTNPGSGVAHEVLADRIGSVIEVVESATNTSKVSAEYDSFGTRVSSGDPERYGFTGREHDDETGLIYFRARHYDPALGQFIQRDPIGFAAGDLNLYTYVENDPYNYSDPSGLSSSKEYSKLARKGIVFGAIANAILRIADVVECTLAAYDAVMQPSYSSPTDLTLSCMPGFRPKGPRGGPGGGDSSGNAPKGPNADGPSEQFIGGKHNDTKEPPNDKRDSHHCPAQGCYKDAPISSADGPAIQMEPADHKQTQSWGNSKEAQNYRDEQRRLLSEGKLEEAIQMDIDDIRSQFGDKYDGAIQEMLDYSRTLDPSSFMSR